MNRIRLTIMACGLLIIVGLCLRPPYQLRQTAHIVSRESRVTRKDAAHTMNIGHYWIWNPPQGATNQIGAGYVLVSSVATVNYPRQSAYIGLTLLLTIMGALVISTKKH